MTSGLQSCRRGRDWWSIEFPRMFNKHGNYSIFLVIFFTFYFRPSLGLHPEDQKLWTWLTSSWREMERPWKTEVCLLLFKLLLSGLELFSLIWLIQNIHTKLFIVPFLLEVFPLLTLKHHLVIYLNDILQHDIIIYACL